MLLVEVSPSTQGMPWPSPAAAVLPRSDCGSGDVPQSAHVGPLMLPLAAAQLSAYLHLHSYVQVCRKYAQNVVEQTCLHTAAAGEDMLARGRRLEEAGSDG